MRYVTHVAMFFALLPGASPLAWAASLHRYQ
jgi:hypothetical protein